jgi:hypothetical protein
MPKLIIQDNLHVKKPQVIPVKEGVCAFDALRTSFERLDLTKATLHINDTQVFANNESMLLAPLKNGDSVTVTTEVKGAIVSAVTGVIGIVVDPVLDLAGGLLGSLIDVPEIDSQQKSPNNNFSGQTNIIRAFSQKPLVCGSPRIYPDLVGEPIEYYSDNIKYSESYFFAAHATFSGGQIQAGDTLIGRFAGAGATRYLPDPITKKTTIPNYRTGNEVKEAAGQTIKGQNEGDEGPIYQILASNSGTPPNTPATYVGSTFTYYSLDLQGAQDLSARLTAAGGELNVIVDYTTYDSGGSGTPASGEGRLTSATLIPEDPGVSPEQWEFIVEDFDGPTSPNNDYNGAGAASSFDTTELLPAILGPFVNPTQCAKMFFNIRFDRGLKNTVPIQIVVYELDSKGGSRTGVSETFNVTYTEDTLTEVLRTFEINISNGVSWYEWTIERTNNSTEDTQQPDLTKLEKSYCIVDYGDYDFTNGTMLKSIMTAEQTAGSGSVDNKINIIDGQAEMPSYDVNTGTVLDNAPSRIAADAVMFVWRDFYGYDLSLLNLDELYTISDSLPEDLKTFDYTFDDTSQSVGDVLDVILDVMRVQRYWDGQQMRFWRDEATPINSALLSRADIAAENERSYTLTRSSYVTGQYDSIQVEYVDREINKKAYVYRSIDGSGNIVNMPGQNPKAKTLTGCQNETNAINRAELEIRKILYQRYTLSDTFLDSQRFLGKGDVVLYNEVYEGGQAWGGEILAVNGNTATVGEELELQIGTSYHVFYTNMNGDVIGPVAVTASTSNTFTASSLSQSYVEGDDNAQIGSRYYITEVNDSINRRYRVIERQSSDYNVQINMIGYDERIYEYDTI